MTTIPLNGARLRVRLIEAEVSRLKLDPENPRLHSAYLTHDLPARPNEKQIAAVLEQLPEFQALLDAIMRNDGVFQPPLITTDFRVLEGNRRVTALRKLHAAEPKNIQWRTVTAHQLSARLPAEQERALRAKFHLDYVELKVKEGCRWAYCERLNPSTRGRDQCASRARPAQSTRPTKRSAIPRTRRRTSMGRGG